MDSEEKKESAQEKNRETAEDIVAKYQDANHHHPHKVFWVIGGFVVLAIVLGAVAGFSRARYQRKSYVYYNSGPGMMGGRGMMGRGGEFGIHRGGLDDRDGNSQLGAEGDVTKINGNSITINDGTQDTQITVTSSTSYIKRGKVAKQSDLVTGNNIIVRGTSDSNGVVTATSINIR